MAAPYVKRYPGGFLDLPNQTTPVDSAFLNAVETALLHLLGEAPLADEVGVWSAAGGGALVYQKITNAQIAAGAAIDKTKLGPLNIVDADIAATAGIAKSKLGALNIADADIQAAAAIAISKLAGYPGDATKALRGDGTWGPTTTYSLITNPPSSPANGDIWFATNSLTAGSYFWTFRYNSSGGTYKWEFVGGTQWVNWNVVAHLNASWQATTSLTIPRSGIWTVSARADSVNPSIAESYRENGVAVLNFDNSSSSGGQYYGAEFSQDRTLAAGVVCAIGFSSNGTDTAKQYGTVTLTPVKV